jgi:hypothetical protein
MIVYTYVVRASILNFRLAATTWIPLLIFDKKE